jgi:Ca2+-binding RTX toxin-like protein
MALRRKVVASASAFVVSTAVVFGSLLLAPMTAQAGGAMCHGHVATIVGTAGHDELHGTPGRDVIQAHGGNDDVEGAGGRDWICGAGGRDDIEGNRGNDHLYGGAGRDEVEGDAGTDTCVGERLQSCER